MLPLLLSLILPSLLLPLLPVRAQQCSPNAPNLRFPAGLAWPTFHGLMGLNQGLSSTQQLSFTSRTLLLGNASAAVAIDGEGNVYAYDSARGILRIDPTSGLPSLFLSQQEAAVSSNFVIDSTFLYLATSTNGVSLVSVYTLAKASLVWVSPQFLGAQPLLALLATGLVAYSSEASSTISFLDVNAASGTISLAGQCTLNPSTAVEQILYDPISNALLVAANSGNTGVTILNYYIINSAGSVTCNPDGQLNAQIPWGRMYMLPYSGTSGNSFLVAVSGNLGGSGPASPCVTNLGTNILAGQVLIFDSAFNIIKNVVNLNTYSLLTDFTSAPLLVGVTPTCDLLALTVDVVSAQGVATVLAAGGVSGLAPSVKFVGTVTNTFSTGIASVAVGSTFTCATASTGPVTPSLYSLNNLTAPSILPGGNPVVVDANNTVFTAYVTGGSENLIMVKGHQYSASGIGNIFGTEVFNYFNENDGHPTPPTISMMVGPNGALVVTAVSSNGGYVYQFSSMT